VPISNFRHGRTAPKTSVLNRIDGNRAVNYQIFPPPRLADGPRWESGSTRCWKQWAGIAGWVRVNTAGEARIQRRLPLLLFYAFVSPRYFFMLFDSADSIQQRYQAHAGDVGLSFFHRRQCFLGLLINQSAVCSFMVVWAFIGLSGIVVNNNIVWIDTYNQIVRGALPSRQRIETAV